MLQAMLEMWPEVFLLLTGKNRKNLTDLKGLTV